MRISEASASLLGRALGDVLPQESAVGRGGVGSAAGAQHSLVATIGQPVIGLTAGPTRQLCSGFWCRAGMAPTAVPGSPLPVADARSFRLNSYPNPFNPATTISFTVAGAGPVDLVVHDVAGRLVRHLWSGGLAAGPQAIAWDGADDAGRPVGSGTCRDATRIPDSSRSKRGWKPAAWSENP